MEQLGKRLAIPRCELVELQIVNDIKIASDLLYDSHVKHIYLLKLNTNNPLSPTPTTTLFSLFLRKLHLDR